MAKSFISTEDGRKIDELIGDLGTRVAEFDRAINIQELEAAKNIGECGISLSTVQPV